MKLLLYLCILSAASPMAAIPNTSPEVPVFSARYDYGVGYGNFAVADVNGDGIKDLVGTGANSLIVYFGAPDGRFQPGPVSIVTPSNYQLSDPVLIDLNGDGKLDAIGVGSIGFSLPTAGIEVSLGNGDGTFQPATFYQAGTTDHFNQYVALTDFNGDGYLDAFTVMENDDLWMFAGRGDGTFDEGVLIPTNYTGQYGNIQLFAADLNGDGRTDLIAGSPVGFASLLNNGNGTFTEFDYASGLSREPAALALADLDRDGALDVLVVGVATGHNLIFAGTGQGTFSLQRNVPQLDSALFATIADLNGDGLPDIAASGFYGLEVLFQQRDGSFTAPVSYNISTYYGGDYVVTADLRNIGVQDVLVLDFDGPVSAYLNKGNGNLQIGFDVTANGGTAACVVSADFNGDGIADLAVGVSEGMSILLGTGQARAPYAAGQLLELGSPACPAIGDFNGDGKLDLIFTSGYDLGSGFAQAFLGNGDGTFTAVPQTTPLSLVGFGLVVGDFNGDGKLDFASTSNLLALGNGDGTFRTPVPFVPQGQTVDSIVSADINGDGKPDIVLTDYSTVYILLNTGSGFTETSIDVSQTCQEATPALGDLNGDGFPDLVLGCNYYGAQIYLNDRSGGFHYTSLLSNGGGYPVIQDINGDGISDILLRSSYEIGVYLGTGGVGFAVPFSLGTPYESGFATANAHGQPIGSGAPDLVVGGGSGVQVLFNEGPRDMHAQ